MPDSSLPQDTDNALVLVDFFPYQLSVVANRVSQSIATLFKSRYNLQIPEWRILVTLMDGQLLSFQEVAERTSMDKSRVTRAQQRLAMMGLLEVSEHPEDKRQVRLKLTDRGEEICHEIVPLAKQTEQDLLEIFSEEEYQQLQKLMTKLFERVKEL